MGKQAAVGKVVVVGGYGAIGSRVATLLAQKSDVDVVVAGRDRRRSEDLAGQIGAESLTLDVTDRQAVADLCAAQHTLVNTVEWAEFELASASIAAGGRYLGVVVPNEQLVDQYEAARASGATVLLSAGLACGISNVMARALIDDLGQADMILTAIVTPMATAAGPGTISYMLAKAAEPITLPGSPKLTLPYARSIPFEFPQPWGSLTTYAMQDEFDFIRTLGAPSVTSIAYEPPLAGKLMNAAARAQLTRVGQSKWLQRTAAKLAELVPPPTSSGAEFAVGVEARNGDRRVLMTAKGLDSVAWTAVGIATMAARVARGEVDSGVWLPEQVFEPETFLDELRTQGLLVTGEEGVDSASA